MIAYPISNYSWLPWKWIMEASIKSKKARMGEGIMSIKTLRTGSRRDTFQTQYLRCNCSWITWKWKIISAMDTNIKCKEAGIWGGHNACKVLTSWVEEGYISNTISFIELFMNTMKMKNNFCNGYQYKMQKSQDGGGNNAYKIFICWVEERNICKHNILFGTVPSYHEKWWTVNLISSP